MHRHALLMSILCLAVASLIWLGCAQKSAEELYTLATEAQQAGQVQKALKHYENLSKTYPDSEHAFKAGFMVSYLSADTTDKAMASVERAYQEYFFNQAQQLQVDGKFGEAVTFYEKFLKEYPASPHAYKAQFMIGFIYNESLKDTTKARLAFEKVIRNYPENDLSDDAKWMIENLNRGPDEIIMGEGK